MKLKRTLTALLAAALLGSSATVAVSALEPHGTGILLRNWLTNDPDYTFSEEYKTSVWYENFTALELTENDRNNVLRIAVSQLGYHEGEDGDYSGKNTSSSGNCVEYFRLLVPNWSNNSDEWCACFVNWCLNQARVDHASSEIGCWKWVLELKAMGLFEDSAAYAGTYTPQPADMIFFNWKGTNTTSGHIGYVLYTTADRVYTIEGNADNNVMVRSYALDDPCVIGYGTPDYDEGDEATLDYSYTDGMPHGYYVVNSYTASLTSSPTSGRICRVPVGSRVLVRDIEGDYAKVTYGDKNGYLPTSILYLLSEVEEDILTYDANGGDGAPEATRVFVGEAGTVSDTVPTLEGDTFLGWSLKPYHYKVNFKPGDSISLAGDTTLYAVWEKRSLVLAAEAYAEGLVVAFERPTATANSGALLPGTLPDLKLLTPLSNTEVQAVTDAAMGQVLSVTSTAASADPYITVPYASLCRTLRFAPKSADEVSYIVLLVKDVSMHDGAMELSYKCGDDRMGTVSCLLSDSHDWQYVVFDMTEATGWNGDIQSLRLDWEKTADAAGNNLLVADICFAANEAERDALCNGEYIYPPQALLEPETTPTDTADTIVDPGNTTDLDSDTDKTGDNIPVGKGGCSSTLAASAVITVSALGAVILRKKKED